VVDSVIESEKKIGLNGQDSDQHLEKLKKETFRGFKQVWEVIVLMQENKATKLDLYKSIIIAVVISVLMNITIILLIKL
jgi:hypothetical protein